MIKRALCIYAMTTLISLGSFAYAENTEDNSSEQTDRPVVYEEPQQEESLVYFDEDQPEFFACSCKDKDKKKPEGTLACICEEEETNSSKPLDDEPESLLA